MDRRTYLRQMAFVTGGILVAPNIIVSCKDKLKNIKLASSLEPFKTLEEIRHFVRLSEGHLKLELERLIKKKDAEAIFNFVNERIASIPGNPNSIASCAYDTRWGREGMLRCGKGTLREKSDLLFYALSEAGFSPDYHRASFQMNPELVQQVYCRKWLDNNAIEVDEGYVDKWDDALSPTQKGTVTKSVDVSKSQQLSNNILESLPEGYEEDLAQVDWLEVSTIEAPIVRASINGSVRDLNFVQGKTFLDFGRFSDDLLDLDLNEVNAKLNKVRISVNAIFSHKLDERKEIVQGEWEVGDLLGKQVALQCMPTLPQEAMLQVPIKDIQQFVPVLSLQNPQIPKDNRINYSFKGVGFDLMGNTFAENEDGTIQMNGLKLSEAYQQDTSSVSSLKVELLDNEYPTIKLKCLPMDANGIPILGLSGSAFEIFDQEKRQFPVVLQNTATNRVLIFFDSTASMPYPYAATEVPEETLTAIYSGFKKSQPSVVFETRMFQLNFLEALGSLELKKYDHILCIGDGEAFEEVTSEELKKIVGDNSISYHFIKNGSSRQSSEQVERCFSGANFPFYRIENLENDLAQIGDQLSKRLIYPYLLSYEAPYEGDNMIHSVSVHITENNTVSPVKSSYVVDRERIYDEDRFPCGISITLDWDEEYSSRSITKHIAGFNPNVDKELHPQHKEQIRSFALGTHRFFFEADKATLPALLDQSLSTQLSVAPFFEDPKSRTEDQLEQINEFEILPTAGLSVFAPLPDPGNDWTTFENNFQTCLYSEFIDFELQKSFKKVDIWETSDVRTFSPSKKKSFEKTLEATSLLALSESTLFQDSTLSQLKNKAIRLYSDDTIDSEIHPEFSVLSSQSYLNHLLYDASFKSKAYWKINKSSGAILGIMPDGSGGGIEASIAQNLKIIDSYAGAYNKAAAPLMSDPLAFGTVTIYGQFLARLYGLVCVAVLSLDAAKLPADSRQAIKKLAYGVIKSFAFSKFGKLKNFEKILDKLFDPGWPKIE